MFYDALQRAGVQAELHIYGYGEHGVGLAPGDTDVREWPALLVNWLRRSGFLTGKRRQAVTGRLTLDGAPMGMAWVTLDPLDRHAPAARTRTSKGEDGRFSIPASHGVVAGPHQVTVHHVSEQYPHVKTGAYSMEDAVCYEVGVLEIGADALLIEVASGGRD